MGILTVKSENLNLNFNDKSGKYEIDYDSFSWTSQGRKPYIIIRHKLGKKYTYTYRTFGSALNKEHKVVQGKIISEYSGFIAFGKKLDFKLICTAEIISDNKVIFSLIAENETKMDIQAVYYPAPFGSKQKTNGYAVDSMRQGMIVPDNHKKNWQSIFLLTKYWRKINSGDCYMPLWGRVCNENGFSAIVETPYDATMFSCYGKGRSFLNSVNWMSSLGRLSYERKVLFTFHKNCDYNTICKDYRTYLIENNDFVTLNEKIEKNPNVKRLIGTPILHCGIYSNIQPESNYYDKKDNSKNQVIHSTFENRAKQYEKIKSMGLDNLYIHTDGWGEMGYDNAHPYVLPPCAEAGGYEGMKFLANRCEELGYTFGIHDQYRDFYYTCKKFDNSLAVKKINGANPYCDIWAGGKHTWLCASKALDFLVETYTELENHGVNIKGAYLDVFAVMPGDECFDENHKITREQCIEYRRKCFEYLKSKGIITSSEEPASQMINTLDLVHHGPYAVRPQGRGKGVGISVPLNNLVYHGAVFVPWISSGVGGWGIPDGDSARLHCILNANTPYFEPFEDDKLISDEKLKAEIENVKEICNIQKELYDVEMISHKFLDGSFRKQQTSFADGTKITVDFDKNTFAVEK